MFGCESCIYKEIKGTEEPCWSCGDYNCHNIRKDLKDIIKRYDEFESINIRNTDDYNRRVRLREQLYLRDFPKVIEYLRGELGE